MEEKDTKKKIREKNGSTPIAEVITIPIPEKWQANLEKVREERESQIKKIAAFIREKYGENLTDDEVLKIDAATQERRECEKCTGYPCHKTENRGFIPVIQVDSRWGLAVASAMCKPYEERQRQIALDQKFACSKIPPRYLGKTYSDYEVDEFNRSAVEFAKRVLPEKNSGAYFWGDVGTGKTFLAALVAQDFIRAGKSVLFTNVADLLMEFYAIYRGTSKADEQELFNALYTADLVVLDDFGIEKPTLFVGTTLCKILDARYNRSDVTTLITSNYSLREIKQRLNDPRDGKDDDLCLNGSRVYDRCIEICKPIFFKGESRRR